MATRPACPLFDANNFRGELLWECVLCGDYFSLWDSPTLWDHLASTHGVTRSQLEHDSTSAAHPSLYREIRRQNAGPKKEVA